MSLDHLSKNRNKAGAVNRSLPGGYLTPSVAMSRSS